MTEPEPPAGPPSRTRDPGLDALKGFAILLVVLGHAISVVARVSHPGAGLVDVGGMWIPAAVAEYPLYVAVYAYHMPLFAFVSGLVLWRPQPEPILMQLRKRALGLLVPYFSWFTLYYLVGAARGSVVLSELPAGLLSVAVDPKHDYALWYLWALFICAVILAVLQHLPGRRMIILASVLIALVAPPFGLAQARYIYPFVAAGWLIAPMRRAVVRYRWPLVLAGAILFSALLANRLRLQVPGFSLGSSDMGPAAIYLCTLAGVVATYALYLGASGLLLRQQVFIGKRTIGIYATHSAIQVLTLPVLAALGWPVMFAASVLLSLGVTVILERVPLASRMLLGNRRPVAMPGTTA